jgi:hypothetical protein
MATVIKDPALVHTALPPKKLDNHVYMGLTNDCAKFGGASLLREGGNRVLQTVNSCNITNSWTMMVEILTLVKIRAGTTAA